MLGYVRVGTSRLSSENDQMLDLQLGRRSPVKPCTPVGRRSLALCSRASVTAQAYEIKTCRTARRSGSGLALSEAKQFGSSAASASRDQRGSNHAGDSQGFISLQGMGVATFCKGKSIVNVLQCRVPD